jgi:hypothetical protein
VTNDSGQAAHLVWGHHCVLGPPFLERGCRLETAATEIRSLPQVWEQTARLEPGQRERWPYARLRGERGYVDLRAVPGEEAGSHDDVYLCGFERGWLTVTNPRLDLAFRLDWDAQLFRWIVVWMPYGGARELPLCGSYALGVEPWSAMTNLEQAVADGEAIELGPRQAIETTLRVSFVAAAEAAA